MTIPNGERGCVSAPRTTSLATCRPRGADATPLAFLLSRGADATPLASVFMLYFQAEIACEQGDHKPSARRFRSECTVFTGTLTPLNARISPAHDLLPRS